MTLEFAKRITHLEAEGAYAVLARAQALEKQGREIIHLEIGQPDFLTPEHIRNAGIQAIRDGFTRYNPPAGLPRLRAIIAEDAGRRRGINITANNVVIGPGAKPGLFFPALALINPGDEVLYPDPGFPTYAAMIGVAGGVPIPISLKEDNQFSFDLKVFDANITDKTKLIILNSPANPTGGVIPIEDLEYIAQRAVRDQFWVMADEIYSRQTYDGLTASSIASFPGMSKKTVIIDGFSKTYAMTGWRLGYAIMPQELAERVELLMVHSIGCTATFTQMAGIDAILGDQACVDEMMNEFQKRRDRIVSGLNSIRGINCQNPKGAFYAFPNIKSFGRPSKEIARRLLDEMGVAVLAGTDFGPGGEGYLRLCYATSMEMIDHAIEKIRGFFEQHVL